MSVAPRHLKPAVDPAAAYLAGYAEGTNRTTPVLDRAIYNDEWLMGFDDAVGDRHHDDEIVYTAPCEHIWGKTDRWFERKCKICGMDRNSE